MNTSSKFVVATHVLTGLAGKREYFCEGTTTSSKMLAESVNTNPVVIRRILAMLNKAGLIISKPGSNGGALLSRNPNKITLDEIYRAVNENEGLFHSHYRAPSSVCPIGANIQTAMGKVINKVEKLVEDYFATVTLKKIMDDTLGMSGILEYLNEGLTAEEIEKKLFSGEIIVNKN